MEARGEMIQIKDAAGLEKHWQLWQAANSSGQPNAAASAAPLPIGYVLSLEGADSILTPGHLERSYAQGLRALGPAHYGPGIYAQGTDATGGLGPRGRELLAEMDRLGMILHVTHFFDGRFLESLDHFHCPGLARQSNWPALV